MILQKYYMMVNDDTNVYVVDSIVNDAFQKMLKNWKKVGDEPAFRGFYKCCEKCGKLRCEK